MPRYLATVAILAAALLSGRAWGQDADLWRRVAQSDAIVVGRLDFQPPEPGQRTYIKIPLDVSESLFGQVGCRSFVNWYSEPSAYAPASQQLLALNGQPALLFLIRADGELYFAGATPSSAATASQDAIDAARAEIGRQAGILSNLSRAPDAPHSREVRRTIDRIVTLKPSQDREQQRLFERLEALGPSAVPALILQMDDDRPLPTSAISLVNHSPEAFEGIRHYGPDVMSEALAAILNQLTGESFGDIYNGATRAERRRAIDGWRIYLDQLSTHAER